MEAVQVEHDPEERDRVHSLLIPPLRQGNKGKGEIQVRAEEEGGGYKMLPWGHG